MKKSLLIKIITCVLLSALTAVFLISCSGGAVPDVTGTAAVTGPQSRDIPVKPVYAVNLAVQVKSGDPEIKPADREFILTGTSFALELFKRSVSIDKNSMVSPLSVLLALSMTANGAAGETLAQMEKTIGGTLGLDELNQYLRGYTGSLTNTEKAGLTIANSVWFCDDENGILVNDSFLQANADYYQADAYKAAFDDRTVADINGWISSSTEGLIDGILTEIPAEAVMYLINAMVFDAEWQKVYSIERVFEGNFYAQDGSAQTAGMMRSEEELYLEDGSAVGFIKPYADGQYSFAALLPGENVPIHEYIASMTAENFIKTIENAKKGIVNAVMPRFSSEYELEMNDVLKDMGITDAFDDSAADFSGIGHSGWGNMYISSVLHKTYISVDELGTKAGAVTSVEISAQSAAEADYYTVTLDRPFVYAVIDSHTNMPLFIGSVLSMEN